MTIATEYRATDQDQAQAGSALVVEDDPGVRELIRLALEEEGLLVETAGDSQAALARAALHWPGVLVLDMGLPALDGAWLVDTLRETYGKVPPVVLVTADDQAARKARRVGAFCYLPKPFDLAELVSAVRHGLTMQAVPL